jgi:hypothetical protein
MDSSESYPSAGRAAILRKGDEKNYALDLEAGHRIVEG